MDFALGDIAAGIGGELLGDPGLRIQRIGPLQGATEGTIAFLANPRYQSQLADTRASCVIVAPALRDAALARGAAIVAPDPYLCFARLTQWWAARTRSVPPVGVHASAVVDASAVLGEGVTVGPLAVIEAGVVLEAGCTVGAQGFIGANARIGCGTRLAARVTVGERCRIGARGIVHSGVVIGADGFGFAPVLSGEGSARYEKIEQLGAVRIGDDVEIGANTCIDRGALDDTVIGDGVKLDNLIQIGHNVRIGDHTAMAGCVGVAGSATIGAHCTVGGGAIVPGDRQRRVRARLRFRIVRPSSAVPSAPTKFWTRVTSHAPKPAVGMVSHAARSSNGIRRTIFIGPTSLSASKGLLLTGGWRKREGASTGSAKSVVDHTHVAERQRGALPSVSEVITRELFSLALERAPRWRSVKSRYAALSTTIFSVRVILSLPSTTANASRPSTRSSASRPNWS